MATPRIAHFGADECIRVLVLSRSGYDVDDCGTSIPKLESLLRSSNIDAIAVSEDIEAIPAPVVEIARSFTSAPIILF